MSIDALKERLPDFAKDVRLNLSSMAGDETLAVQTKYGLFLAAAIATRNADVMAAMEAEAAGKLTPAAAGAARAAASMMAMNNVYYRFRHMIGKESYSTKRAGLRMNRLAQVLTTKVDFELVCLAVSAINGCEMCMQSHEKVVLEGGLSEDQVHDAVRIAAVIHAAAVGLES